MKARTSKASKVMSLSLAAVIGSRTSKICSQKDSYEHNSTSWSAWSYKGSEHQSPPPCGFNHQAEGLSKAWGQVMKASRRWWSQPRILLQQDEGQRFWTSNLKAKDQRSVHLMDREHERIVEHQRFKIPALSSKVKNICLKAQTKRARTARLMISKQRWETRDSAPEIPFVLDLQPPLEIILLTQGFCTRQEIMSCTNIWLNLAGFASYTTYSLTLKIITYPTNLDLKTTTFWTKYWP